MAQHREQRRAADRGARRRRAVAGGMAVATTAVVAGWGAPASAGTVAPSVHALCNIIEGTPAVSGRLVDFPPNDDLLSLIVMKGPKDGRTFTFTITIGTDTDAQGTATTPGGTSSGVSFSGVPVEVGWITFRDVNGNVRWDERVDETLYRGSGDVTACPQDVTLSPK